MDLGALAAFGPVPAGPGPAFRGALQGAAVEDHGGRLGRAAFAQTDQHTQVGDDGLEDPGLDPAAGLLVDRRPGRQIAWHEAPLEAGAGDVAQPVEEFPQRMVALRRIFAHQGQVGGQEGPFLIGNIGGVAGAGWGIHAPMVRRPTPKVHNRL